MKKILCCFIVCYIILVFFPAFASSMYDSFTPQLKNAVHKEIGFYENLKTCTPTSFSSDKISMRVNGTSNGNCNWNINQGNSGMFDFKCNASIAKTAQFASLKIAYLKAVYGLSFDSPSEAMDNMLKDGYITKYCN